VLTAQGRRAFEEYVSLLATIIGLPNAKK